MTECVAYYLNDGRSMIGPQQELRENQAVIANEVENQEELNLAGKSTLFWSNWGGGRLIPDLISNNEKLPYSVYLSKRPQAFNHGSESVRKQFYSLSIA
ncbi:MAG: hypothetical protein P8L44_00970 [Opitutales bacterium]|jgi:hypothetical protein|nr:hypothetical protein [Opitutales bacterium]